MMVKGRDGFGSMLQSPKAMINPEISHVQMNIKRDIPVDPVTAFSGVERVAKVD